METVQTRKYVVGSGHEGEVTRRALILSLDEGIPEGASKKYTFSTI